MTQKDVDIFQDLFAFYKAYYNNPACGKEVQRLHEKHNSDFMDALLLICAADIDDRFCGRKSNHVERLKEIWENPKSSATT